MTSRDAAQEAQCQNVMMVVTTTMVFSGIYDILACATGRARREPKP
jgi:hypothetical protein